MRRLALLALALLMLLMTARAASAMELWSDEEGEFLLDLNTTLKLSSFISRDRDHSGGYDSNWSALGLYRLRFELSAGLGDFADARFAYEHSGRGTTREDKVSGVAVLPSTAELPYRLTQLYWDVPETDHYTGFHEVDRALACFHPAWGEVTVGRQAIGLGRGRLFSAVDMFAPFSPLEVDREWRRGVDAVRAEYRLSPTTSLEGIAVGGESWEDSALLLRGRGYFGEVDAAVLGGKRGRDEFVAGVLSAVVAEAEVHTELAVFRIPDPHPLGQFWGADRYVPKFLLGSSYTFNVGNGLTVLAEYHYSGFGAADISDATALFSRRDYQKRLVRGDTQILGRHALGFQATYRFNESLNGSMNLLVNPEDGSGLLSPSLRWDASRSTSLLVTGYVPWGPESKRGVLRSEFGASPYSLFVQLAFYF